MAAFNDALDLRTAVVEHVGQPAIADVWPRLVSMAESRLNRTLRMRDQMTTATVDLTSGTATLPADFAEGIGLFHAQGYEYVMQPSQQKRGKYYHVSGGNLVSEDISGELEFQYYATLPTLADSLTATNWLLTKYPDVYLYAVAFEAAKYVRDAELAAQTREMMSDAIAMAKGDDEAARYSRARVRVAGVTP